MRHRQHSWFRDHFAFVALVGITSLLMLGSFIDWVVN